MQAINNNLLSPYIQRIVCLIIALILMAMVLSSGPVSALSSDQSTVFNEGILYFDTTVPGDTGSGCMSATMPSIIEPAQVASAIDKYIEDSGGTGSPLDGLGSQIVTGAQNSGVNPFLIVAIAQKESSFGAQVPTDSYNAFGRTATDEQPSVTTNGRQWYKWPSWEASVDGSDDEPSFIKSVYIEQGQTQLIDVINKYAPAADSNNPTEYTQQITSWIQQMVGNAGTAVDCGQGNVAGGVMPPSNPSGNIALGQQLAATYSWGSGNQWECLYNLWQNESSWKTDAYNDNNHDGRFDPVPNGINDDAYGIPQALPGAKMADPPGGPDWQTNPATQINWGLNYIKDRYQTPCNAWALWQSRSPHWY